jgi:hypothetical protein
LAPGSAWLSETLNTSPPTVATGRRTFQADVVRKWVTWQGQEFIQDTPVGDRAFPGAYAVGDSEPGFGDWDALNVHTLPATAAGIRKLLSSGRLEAGQDRVEARVEAKSPLIWLAQLAAMLADDPNTPAAHQAAFTVIEQLPGLQQLGTVRDPQGRTGTAVAEQASNLYPLLIATGPGCANPYARSVLNHLTRRGAKRIALMTNPVVVSYTVDVEDAYREWCADHDMPPRVSHVGADLTESAGYAAAQKLLSLEPKPDAIYATYDRLGVGALLAARAVGISLPGDLLIAVTATESSEAAATRPSLTALSLHPDQIGERAAAMLIALVEGREPDDVHALVPTRLIPRMSTRRTPSTAAAGRTRSPR